MFANALTALLFLPISIYAQSSPTIVCIPGQCLSGYSNTTIGTTLKSSTNVVLLPGVYSVDTNPQLLHDALTSSSASLSPSPGFNGSNSVSLPLTVALQPGVSFYANSLYAGQASFSSLPTSPSPNTSVPITASSFALSSNVWLSLNAGSNNRVIVWISVPDVSQLPSGMQGSLAIQDIQSSACTPACAASGVCTPSGTCLCQPGFNGTSCETCAPGFFGPTCQPCPPNCDSCDQGITGTGRCLKPTITNAPASCNCKSGVCNSDGSCSCTPGFTTGNDGTQCSKCLPGFFLDSNGNCQVCQIGCTQCSDGTGQCTSCASGFSQSSSDPTKCNPLQAVTTTNQFCPDGSFPNGASCSVCSSECQTCTGPTSNDCIICATGLFTNNGSCISVNNVGVCQGTNLIADNTKRECDSCGATCTKCQIPGFDGASLVAQKQCTACLPGFFLNNGTCVDSCPSGTTVSSQDNLTCIPCTSPCSTCSGSSSFCLTCTNNQLASKGQCVSNCPSSTFSSDGACLSCHPDCASCSGGSFNQCTSCPPNRPVLINGRCLPTCTSNQFFDAATGQCQSCDASCATCSGAGPANCLSCASASQKLQGGSCASANCASNANVIAGLGVCLSDLVVTTTAPGQAPLPTVAGIDSNTVVVRGRGLQWWEILLMVLGCMFIFVAVLWCLRRRQKKKRQAKLQLKAGMLYSVPQPRSWRARLVHWVIALFSRKGKDTSKHSVVPAYDTATSGAFLPTQDKAESAHQRTAAKTDTGAGGWRWKLIRWGEKFFGHPPSTRLASVPPKIVHLGPIGSDDAEVSHKLRLAEEAEASFRSASPFSHSSLSPPPPLPARPLHDVDMVRLIESYNRPVPASQYIQVPTRLSRDRLDTVEENSLSDTSSRLSAESVYSQVTQVPRRTPNPRMPVKNDPESRFDASMRRIADRF